MSKLNVFIKVIDLQGNKYTYQLPNDINSMVLEEYKTNKDYVKRIYEGALITVPMTKYDKDGNAKMQVVKVLTVFTRKRKIYWRCRGQFTPKVIWSSGLEGVN